MKKRRKELKRGPKGGKKHQPGRGHARKSQRVTKNRFMKKAAKLRKQQEELARKQWEHWDRLTEGQKKFFEEERPQFPRPTNEESS